MLIAVWCETVGTVNWYIIYFFSPLPTALLILCLWMTFLKVLDTPLLAEMNVYCTNFTITPSRWPFPLELSTSISTLIVSPSKQTFPELQHIYVRIRPGGQPHLASNIRNLQDLWRYFPGTKKFLVEKVRGPEVESNRTTVVLACCSWWSRLSARIRF